MKRSELNQIMREAVQFVQAMNYKLPPFAYWNAEKWSGKGEDYAEIRENMLGWDITDFGSGNFIQTGLLLFTVRNGNFHQDSCQKTYAEKLLIVEEGQVTPLHFHWSKMEDIINRGGGNLMVQMYSSTEDDQLADTPIEVSVDGRKLNLPAGSTVRLTPGESITLPPRLYHKLWGEEGSGKVLITEISSVNDDRIDNRFLEPIGRFPAIEEDEEPLYLLYTDYLPPVS
ncbi:D-lyxose/D-mannose family sugar isomerase [Paenibacillus sp. GCM10027626]|uniref:D-lyxose/D-mannose family sugar isomerase n=1 Tax=Paenibacillus sp. GCM10027626 TaxID=3273411 RepID=UPI0036261221